MLYLGSEDTVIRQLPITQHSSHCVAVPCYLMYCMFHIVFFFACYCIVLIVVLLVHHVFLVFYLVADLYCSFVLICTTFTFLVTLPYSYLSAPDTAPMPVLFCSTVYL